jgi:K+-sensing histidine kinase KdpD
VSLDQIAARADPAGRLRGTRPTRTVGVIVAVASVAAATGAIYPLSLVANAVSLSVVYLPAVLLVSTIWGLPLGLFTCLLSATAFNFFHIPPVGRFTIADSRNWVALGAFTVVAVVASTIADLARNRAQEADRRRREADLAATLARNRGRLMTHRDLLVSVWGGGYAEDTQVLRAHIANLRRKIEPPDGPRFIRTDPGVGYRFTG